MLFPRAASGADCVCGNFFETLAKRAKTLRPIRAGGILPCGAMLPCDAMSPDDAFAKGRLPVNIAI